MSHESALSALVAARSLFNAGNFAAAERMLKRALSDEPQLDGAHALLSLAQYQGDRGHDALASANAAIALSPSADAFRAQSLALGLLGRRADAVVAGKAAVSADAVDELAALVLAVAFEKAKQPRGAEAAYRRAIELAPDNAAIRADLCFFLLRRHRLKEAEREAAAIDGESDRAGVLLLRANLALCRGRPDVARDHALWLLSRDATNPAALEVLAQVKASESLLLGLWWRYSLFLAKRPRWVHIFIVFPIMCALILLLGPVSFVILLYLWISKLAFARMMGREQKTVRLRKEF